jgi:[acyl-carrier-protein] S-malonyltransferase
MNKAFIFPGQGSQAVGMGKDLANNFSVAREVFKIVDEALEQNLSNMIFEGPIESLTMTENTQPALMGVSMAFIEVIKTETGKQIHELCDIVAGHSLGEYTALCAAGAISIFDAAKILRIRGKSMQEACPKGEGSMAAILGMNIDQVEVIVEDANKIGICDIANDNNATQVVISGSLSAIDFVSEKVTELGGRAIKLNVSAPFHSRLIKSAENVMRKALDEIEWTKPLVPIISNVTVKPTQDVSEIKDALVKQISGRVRWRETIEFLAQNGVNELIEIGSGKVLTGMLRKVEHGFVLVNVGNIEELKLV